MAAVTEGLCGQRGGVDLSQSEKITTQNRKKKERKRKRCKIRPKHIKGSRERYLLRQNTAYELSEQSA